MGVTWRAAMWLAEERPWLAQGGPFLHHDHSTGINDVIDELAHCLALKEAPRNHSDDLCTNLPKC